MATMDDGIGECFNLPKRRKKPLRIRAQFGCAWCGKLCRGETCSRNCAELWRLLVRDTGSTEVAAAWLEQARAMQAAVAVDRSPGTDALGKDEL